MITTVIALGISLCSFTFSAVIITLFLLCTGLTPENDFWILIKLVIGIMLYVLVHLPFQLKRLKKGMPFLYELNFNNAGFFLSICIIICVIIICTPYTLHTYIIMSSLFLIFPCALLLISWWRAIITRNYLRKLQQFEMQKLKPAPAPPENSFSPLFFCDEFFYQLYFLIVLALLLLLLCNGFKVLISVNPYRESRKATSAFG